jgi:hypothetical protein
MRQKCWYIKQNLIRGVNMTPQEVLTYYGSQYKFQKETRMSHTSLGNWMKWGFVPENSQYKLERLTKGQLKTDWTNELQEKAG